MKKRNHFGCGQKWAKFYGEQNAPACPLTLDDIDRNADALTAKTTQRSELLKKKEGKNTQEPIVM